MLNLLKKVIATSLFITASYSSFSASIASYAKVNQARTCEGLFLTPDSAAALVELYCQEFCNNSNPKNAAIMTHAAIKNRFNRIAQRLINARDAKVKKRTRGADINVRIRIILNDELLGAEVSPDDRTIIMHNLKRIFSPRIFELLEQRAGVALDSLDWLLLTDGLKEYVQTITENIVRYACNIKIYDNKCAICLEQFDVGEPVTLLPCNHFYHSCCISADGSRLNVCDTDACAAHNHGDHHHCPNCRAAFKPNEHGVRLMTL